MPTLNWIGKDKVVSHHQDVPFRVLEHKYGFTAKNGDQTEPTESGNKIIHGDNLEALKSLLPEYEGKIKCIYIDPPYNTGNESWVYNDNVNHPKIKKWLGEVVGKDGEDLTRHDKWLCMMYPRLQLLHKLLADDGAIFISIDDNEQANLKLICDEIFGIRNYIATLVWKKKAGGGADARFFANDHEYLLCYCKNITNQDRFYTGLSEKLRQEYKYKDDNFEKYGAYKRKNLHQTGIDSNRPNLNYEILMPDGTIKLPPTIWRWSKEKFESELSLGKIDFVKNRKGEWQVYTKMYQFSDDGQEYKTKPRSILLENGLTRDGNIELKNIFKSKVFDYSKPSKLIMHLLNIISNKNSIILDSFAGSGTTAQAVLNLNKQDGGNRKFILVEMEDYANGITAERVKRVAKGYGKDKKAVEGTGGTFDFYELGLPIFDDNQNLNEEVCTEKIREYIWFSETRTPFKPPKEINYFLGKKDDSVYYFIYEKSKLTTLDFDALELIKNKGEQYVIYADNCLLPKDFMAKNNIIFKKIPRDITRF
ncbi:site-specific DNA-methyltransferase [Bizionia paragorgiae]|uniref:site-specific DNA-methyltransferase (adenine-specific) n=1 Tax=Bizionia paragorgiae TaxID=283786 RepID=A0A1H4ASY6_BIZPA|nr:site-specific DNA-methyltransferase [Bizionia paragorgiae]SEA39045.1 adenine-specific DNA-methyltransferase [Bizionia paragorgiae]